MPGSNRGLYIALGIAGLIGLLIALATLPNVPNLKAYDYESARSKQYHAGEASCQPTALAAVRDKAQRLSQSDACNEKAEEHRLQTNDLIQQTRAADAAKAQADIASQGLWTGWFQTIGGYVTLVAAIAAAVYARDAAKHTKDSVVETKRIGEAQTRAYLSIIDATGMLVGNVPQVAFTLQNTGQSPALKMKISLELTALRLSEGPSEHVDLKRSLPGIYSVAANSSFKVPYHALDPLPDTFTDMDYLSLMFKAECDWVDVFETRQSDKGVFGTLLSEMPDSPFEMPHYHTLLASILNENVNRKSAKGD